MGYEKVPGNTEVPPLPPPPNQGRQQQQEMTNHPAKDVLLEEAILRVSTVSAKTNKLTSLRILTAVGLSVPSSHTVSTLSL